MTKTQTTTAPPRDATGDVTDHYYNDIMLYDCLAVMIENEEALQMFTDDVRHAAAHIYPILVEAETGSRNAEASQAALQRLIECAIVWLDSKAENRSTSETEVGNGVFTGADAGMDY